MDREIGRVLDQLEAMDAFRDTVILFLSGNGASSEQLIGPGGLHASAPPGSARSRSQIR
jgi:arylsulfatase A-like enzyme